MELCRNADLYRDEAKRLLHAGISEGVDETLGESIKLRSEAGHNIPVSDSIFYLTTIDTATYNAAISKGDTSAWPVPHSSATIGQLIYVTWLFNSETQIYEFHAFQRLSQWEILSDIPYLSRINKVTMERFYLVASCYFVTFDASSGRVVKVIDQLMSVADRK